MEDIATRAVAYSIPGVVVDGNDVFAVYEAVKTAVEQARSGEGPSLVECKTYRHRGHYEGDPQIYKTPEEVSYWKERDPIVQLRQKMTEANLATTTELDALEAEVKAEIEAAVEFAKQSPYPTVDQVTLDVYANDNERSVMR